ncbi:hypothetical protein [Paraburkholderia rhizosphaerae]|uniref:hypothetical protein n=1 Tax=Paraburkholderia rhizosphaerae TaxID=480658 RepID=UPI00106525B4|nr:hypothetical protein [Paraburkholderia rhizosphaerae]
MRHYVSLKFVILNYMLKRIKASAVDATHQIGPRRGPHDSDNLRHTIVHAALRGPVTGWRERDKASVSKYRSAVHVRK